MTLPALSPDQAEAWDAIAEALAQTGIDLASEEVAPAKDGKGRVMAVFGKAAAGQVTVQFDGGALGAQDPEQAARGGVLPGSGSVRLVTDHQPEDGAVLRGHPASRS